MVNVKNLSTFEKVKRGCLILLNKCSERRVLVNVSVVIEVKQYILLLQSELLNGLHIPVVTSMTTRKDSREVIVTLVLFHFCYIV